VLVGIGLTFVQVNASQLRKKTHSNPGLALYRFKWYRLGMAIVAIVVGVLIISDAVGVV
jgi:hypothetical protein